MLMDSSLRFPGRTGKKYVDHAKYSDSMFLDMGTTRVIECWADDVSDGTLTDFRKAVQAKDDEDVIFSWIEWPDKETRNAAYVKMEDPNNTDPRMDPVKNPMPFDGKRMIFGGFTPIVIMEK